MHKHLLLKTVILVIFVIFSIKVFLSEKEQFKQVSKTNIFKAKIENYELQQQAMLQEDNNVPLNTENEEINNSTNLAKLETCEYTKLAIDTENNRFINSTTSYAIIIPIESSNYSVITVEKLETENCILATSTLKPSKDITLNNLVNVEKQAKAEIHITSEDKFLYVLYGCNGYWGNYTQNQVKNSVRIYYGTKWIEDTSLYKPLGKLSKGYIMLSCDDGNNALASYTIPMLLEKNVPCTFGLMDSSQIFSNQNELNMVQNMVAEHGCDVAIHGTNSYTSYTKQNLINFLDKQKTFLTNESLIPHGIIFPNHEYNNETLSTISTYYEVCCTGGTNTPIYYSGFGAGPESNRYSLYRFSIVNSSIEAIKSYINIALENNYLLLPFWHDNTIANNTEYQNKLEAVIDYAKEVGITFITIKDVPKLNVSTDDMILGDINGDGKINIKDWNRMYEYINETSELSESEFTRGDINCDKKVNIKDWNRMYEHITEVNPL